MPLRSRISKLLVCAPLLALCAESVTGGEPLGRGSVAWGGRDYGRMEFLGERDRVGSGLVGGGLFFQAPFNTMTVYEGPWPPWGYGPVMWGYSNPYLGPGSVPMYGPQVAPLPRLLPPLDGDGWQGPAGGDRLPDRQPARPQQGGGGRAAAIPDQPDQDNPAVLIRPSSVEQRRKSLRYLAQGDEQFHRHDYLASVGKYRQATQAARDLAEPRLKLGMALATIAEYQQAVSHLKFGLRLDPNWPDHGESLDELFGEGHDLAKNSILRNIGRWVEEDIRDPDRLFLFGVFLYFNNDLDSARRVLETAAAITHGADHVRAFLTEQPQRVQAPPQPGIAPQVAEAQPAGPRGQHPRPRGGRDEQTGRNRPPAIDDAPVPHPPEEPDEGRSAGERR